MRKLIHLSDLHFGRVNPVLLDPLIQFIRGAGPDLVVVSGDLTQRARPEEYRAAREFLEALPQPQLIVPGNHDVPLHNPLARFFQSLSGYRRHITDDLSPFFADAEIAVAGVNTARSFTWKNGRINKAQLDRLREDFRPFGDAHVKVVVSHHPFDLPAGAQGSVAGRSQLAVKTLAECGVDMCLAGHFHIADTGHTATRYKIPGYSALLVSSGTTTSNRGRGNPNSFNLIHVAQSRITIDRYTWCEEEADFRLHTAEPFHRTNEGWARE